MSQRVKTCHPGKADWVCVSWFGLSPSGGVEGSLNSPAYFDILHSDALPTLCLTLSIPLSTLQCLCAQSQLYEEIVFPVWDGRTSLVSTEL